MISEEQKSKLASRLLGAKTEVNETSKRETGLKCECGGGLLSFRRTVLPKPPTHRQKRIAKKWRKRWERENRHRILACKLAGLMQPPCFRCTKCGRDAGYYSTLGSNLVQVEPLPT